MGLNISTLLRVWSWKVHENWRVWSVVVTVVGAQCMLVKRVNISGRVAYEDEVPSCNSMYSATMCVRRRSETTIPSLRTVLRACAIQPVVPARRSHSACHPSRPAIPHIMTTHHNPIKPQPRQQSSPQPRPPPPPHPPPPLPHPPPPPPSSPDED